MAKLILGPMLRYVDRTEATVWVEVDEPCEVQVLDATTRTFCVDGHHYALAIVTGLAPGTSTPYDVRLDGTPVWPPEGGHLPPSVIRTLGDAGPLRVVFGSCRTAAPHVPPYSLESAVIDEARGVDALYAHGLRMRTTPPEQWPDLMVMLGDQVYADDASPGVKRRLEARTPPPGLPADNVANFEEYTWLYHESWSSEVERWVLSTVPSTMIFDDHDMIDDWNISQSWVRDVRREPWWEDHIIGGLMSYWIYQHLGNQSPAEIREDGLLERAIEAGDAGDLLRRWARASEEFTPTPGGYRFSYTRDLGPVRLVVVDSRNGRVLEPGARQMVDDDEWAWIVRQCEAPVRDLIIATSLAAFVPPGLHDFQCWSEQLCDGRWGRGPARLGEKLRRAVDLEAWAAFRRSFDAMVELLTRVGSGKAGAPAPRTISIISGDIHFSYRSELHFPDDAGVTSRVNQLVSSPIRNALTGRDRRVLAFVSSRLGRWVGRTLVRVLRTPVPEVSWIVDQGPFFGNEMSQLTFDERGAHLVIEHAAPDERGEPQLTICAAVDLLA